MHSSGSSSSSSRQRQQTHRNTGVHETRCGWDGGRDRQLHIMFMCRPPPPLACAVCLQQSRLHSMGSSCTGAPAHCAAPPPPLACASLSAPDTVAAAFTGCENTHAVTHSHYTSISPTQYHLHLAASHTHPTPTPTPTFTPDPQYANKVPLQCPPPLTQPLFCPTYPHPLTPDNAPSRQSPPRPRPPSPRVWCRRILQEGVVQCGKVSWLCSKT